MNYLVAKLLKTILFAAVPLAILAGVFGLENSVSAAAPGITSWSSSGGTTVNKDNNQDIMYLINQGDVLTFNITIDQAVSYEWSVNKAVKQMVSTPSTLDIFNWTVPSEKGIWEIHLKTWNSSNEEVHKEWVVSTLAIEESPEFFDYFSDMTYLYRSEKDPWERNLPAWSPYNTSYTVLDSFGGFLKRSGDDSGVAPTFGINQEISANMTISYGTWKFKYKFPDGNTGQWGFGIYLKDPNFSRNEGYSKMSDTHHHSVLYNRPEAQFSLDYDGTGWPEDGKWHEVTIIRTPDNWVYMYNDYIFEFYAQNRLNFNPTKILAILERYQGHQVYVDNFEVYRDKYFFPKIDVNYETYTWNYYYNTKDGQFYPETRNGIIVKGRNVKLADIANALNDPAKFTYDPITKTAVSFADLVVYDNAELIIQNETLKFSCSFDGERHFVLKYGAEINIQNSFIGTTGDKYFIWNNASSTTHFGRAPLKKRIDPIEFSPVGFSGAVWPLGNAGVIRFKINNSTVNNSTHIFFDSPMELDIKNTNFTDLTEIDIGNYFGVATSGQARSRQRWFPKGDKSFYVYLDEVNTNKFNLENIYFSGKTIPINVTFLINALRDKLNIYNINLEKENIVVKKTLPQQAGQSHTWNSYMEASYEAERYGGKGTGMDSRLGLVNCKFKDLIIPTDLTWAIPKYYIDIKTVDANGLPVNNASITVINEVDNINYPAENMEEIKKIFDPKPTSPNQYFYLSNQIIQGLSHSVALTDSTGHTPLPTDKNNTLVLADYVKDQISQKNFTYAITAEKDGKTAILTGLDIDENWYRSDPNIPKKTIVCNINSGVCSLDNISTPVPSSASDLNSDSKVNSLDFGILMSAWGNITKPASDINQDGIVNSIDFGIMMSQWG